MKTRVGHTLVCSMQLVVALVGVVLASDPPPLDLEALRALLKNNQIAEAELRSRALLPEVESTRGVESVEVAEVLDVLVEAMWRGGKIPDAEARGMAERAIAIKERILGPADLRLAKSLGNAAVQHAILGETAAARPLFERALAIREQALGPESSEVGATLNNLANLLGDIGEYDAARAAYERAVKIWEKTHGPDSALVAQGLHNLGTTCRDIGDYAAARGYYERALPIAEAALGPDSPQVAETLNGLAIIDWATGDYAAALRPIERSIAIWEKAYGPDHPKVAMAVNTLGTLRFTTGDYAGARSLFERALAINEAAFGPDHPLVARTLSSLGVTLLHTAGPAAARPLLERCLTIREAAFGPDHIDVATALMNLALVDPGAARPRIERALGIREAVLGPDNAYVAESLVALAQVRERAGEFAAARSLLERALAIQEKTLAREHPAVAATLNGLASARAREGDRTGALEWALEAERIARDHLRLTGRALSEREALGYAAVRTSGLDVALSLAAGGLDGPSRRRVLDALVRSRAVVLDEMARRHQAASRTTDPVIAKLAEDLSRTRGRLANLAVHGPEDREPAAYHAELAGARGAAEEAERRLAVASTSFASEQTRARLGLDEVASSLPPESALVAFTLYRRAEIGPSYFAFVLRAGERDPVVADLGPMERIDARIARWKQEAAQPTPGDRGSARTQEASYREAGLALRRAVWDPLAPALVGIERVFVVPDGALNLLSLATLPADEGGYQIEHGPLVHYLSAERDLVPQPVSHRPGSGLLALGDPSYDAATLFAALGGSLDGTVAAATGRTPAPAIYRGQSAACGDFAAVRFEALPATGKETREIVALWNEPARDGRPPRAPALDLRGAAASETAFKHEAPGRQVIHLATHGFFMGGPCAAGPGGSRGIGALTETPPPGGIAAPPPKAGENPLRLSGLALAGANRRAAAGEAEEDGILTAEEIASLDLSQVGWVVLSACDTGAGDVRAGEGVFGLRRAFQVAGAGTLIMSLWSVDDEATRRWMEALYEGRFESDLDTAAAARRASLDVLREQRARNGSTHPFTWGAFVAAGDWR